MPPQHYEFINPKLLPQNTCLGLVTGTGIVNHRLTFCQLINIVV